MKGDGRTKSTVGGGGRENKEYNGWRGTGEQKVTAGFQTYDWFVNCSTGLYKLVGQILNQSGIHKVKK